MVIPIVTAATSDYLPGVRALHNSYLENSSDGFSFTVLAYGDIGPQLDEWGIDYLPDVPTPDGLPPGQKWMQDHRASFARWRVPDLFESRHAIFIDADALILRPLHRWLEFDGPPVAGTRSWQPMSRETVGCNDGRHGMLCSAIAFDCWRWLELGMYDRCVETMRRTDLVFRNCDQSVLQVALRGDWHCLPSEWQAQACHPHQNLEAADVLHFTGLNPWQPIPEAMYANEAAMETRIKARALWQRYHG